MRPSLGESERGSSARVLACPRTSSHVDMTTLRLLLVALLWNGYISDNAAQHYQQEVTILSSASHEQKSPYEGLKSRRRVEDEEIKYRRRTRSRNSKRFVGSELGSTLGPYAVGQSYGGRPSKAYSFSYDTGDHGRQESSDHMGNVKGSYSYVAREDGTGRRVRYEAGPDRGYVAMGDLTPHASVTGAWLQPMYGIPYPQSGYPLAAEAVHGSEVFVLPPKPPSYVQRGGRKYSSAVGGNYSPLNSSPYPPYHPEDPLYSTTVSPYPRQHLSEVRPHEKALFVPDVDFTNGFYFSANPKHVEITPRPITTFRPPPSLSVHSTASPILPSASLYPSFSPDVRFLSTPPPSLNTLSTVSPRPSVPPYRVHSSTYPSVTLPDVRLRTDLHDLNSLGTSLRPSVPPYGVHSSSYPDVRLRTDLHDLNSLGTSPRSFSSLPDLRSSASPLLPHAYSHRRGHPSSSPRPDIFSTFTPFPSLSPSLSPLPNEVTPRSSDSSSGLFSPRPEVQYSDIKKRAHLVSPPRHSHTMKIPPKKDSVPAPELTSDQVITTARLISLSQVTETTSPSSNQIDDKPVLKSFAILARSGLHKNIHSKAQDEEFYISVPKKSSEKVLL